MLSTIAANCQRLRAWQGAAEHALDIARDQVDLEVDALPGRELPSVVFSSVCGIRLMLNSQPSRRSLTRLTVRLTPLTVMEPL